MLTNISKRRHIYDARGVGFDQHYTDSALKLLAPKSYRVRTKWVKTRKAIPKQEILSSLLLFGKAYLSRPTWLSRADFPELEVLEKEDLIEWMPDDVYESAFNYLGLLVEKLSKRAYRESRSNKLPKQVISDYEKYQYKMGELESELSHDILTIIEEILYFLPIIRANLNHLNLNLPDPLSPLLYPITFSAPWLLPEYVIDDIDLKQRFGDFDEFDEYTGFDYMSFVGRLKNRDTDIYGSYLEIEYILAGLFDSLLSSLAAERFAAETSLPIKTNGDAKSAQFRKTILGLESYQLVKIQFHDLRYPVIESIEDVLRLRDDRHLKAYRLVIAEYSERLRQELESERPKVINDFRKDIQSALKSLTIVKRWSKIVDLSFYISLPLAIIGTLYGLPLSDILVIPLTSYAKIVTHQKRKELDWILFGRSDDD